MPDSLRSRAVSGFAWMLLGTGGQAVLRLVLLLVLARLIGPEEFGVVGAGVVVWQLAILFADCGIAAGLVQRGDGQTSLGDEQIRAVMLLALTFGIMLSVGMVASAELIASFFRFVDLDRVLLALSAGPLLYACGAVPEGLLRRDFRFRALGTINVASFALGYVVVGLPLALSGFGMWSVVWAMLLEQMARALMQNLVRPPRMYGPIKMADVLSPLHFSGGFVMRRLGFNLSNNLPNIVVGRLLGAEALGLYGRANQIVSIQPATIGRALGTVMLSVMSRVQHDRKALSEAYLETARIVALVSLPSAVVLGMLAPELIYVVLGREWMQVALPLQIMALGLFLRTAAIITTELATATGRLYAVVSRQWLHSAAILVGSLAGARWGLVGVAVGVLAAQVFAYALYEQLSLRLTGASTAEWWTAHAPGMVTALLLLVTLIGPTIAMREVGLHPILILGADLVLVAVVAVGALYALGLMVAVIACDVLGLQTRE